MLRWSFRALTWGTAIAAVAGIFLALASRRHLFGLGLPEWIFLALVLITGPGLIANTVLKDNWARPRPLHVVEFGGPDRFTPVLERSGACERNCSFVSGEASATFALGFAIAMLARRRRAELMAAAVAAGSIAGLVRMGEGGHFLSDVVFGGVFMALDVALMYWLVFHVLEPRARDEAWWHDKTLAVTGEVRRKSGEAVSGGKYWLKEKFPATFGANFVKRDRPQGDDQGL
jgi:lipid A 4'-phosphatase